MAPLLGALRSRVLPAMLTSLGVVLLTAGLLSYGDPTTAGAVLVPTPTIETPGPTPSATNGATPSPAVSAEPSASVLPTATPGGRAFATRVVVPALNIDLAVVKPPSGYPLCNVAMYIQELGQPGEGRATYLYAHARDGMFGPIYQLAHAGKQRKMLGMIVQVYTSDDKLYLYEVTQVRLHQTTLDAALAATTEQLWLQTSEGPKGTPGKTQVIASLLSVGAADHADAHPRAKPVNCG